MLQKNEIINSPSKIENTSQKYSPNLFKSSTKSQVRVIDLISNRSDVDKQNLMLMYDKKMSTVLTYIEYERANTANIRDDMHKIIDEAYKECHAEIMKGSHNRDLTSLYLQQLAEQIQEIKNNQTISREIIEFACFKLGILCDLSRNTGMHLHDEKKQLLAIPLIVTSDFRKLASVNPDQASNKSVMPIFSKNGTMGMNTILFAELNDYFPVGFNANPYPVHCNTFNKQSFDMITHDYGHAFKRVFNLKNESPEVFEQYKQLYNKIIEEQNKKRIENKLNPIDDILFMKDIFMLFFLVHEIAYHPKLSVSVECIIKERTQLLDDASSIFKYLAESGQDELLTESFLLETKDFIKPLEELGYPIVHYPNQAWKSAASIRAALLDLLNGFKNRHPEIIVTPQQTPTQVAQVN